MATEDIKTIMPGGGGDYTSLNAWETGEQADLVAADRIAVAEVYSGGNAMTNAEINITTGWTMDSTRYAEIRAAVGEGHSGQQIGGYRCTEIDRFRSPCALVRHLRCGA